MAVQQSPQTKGMISRQPAYFDNREFRKVENASHELYVLKKLNKREMEKLSWLARKFGRIGT
jgi:hypothetical protein